MVLPVIFLSMAVLLTVFFVCLSAISENSKIHIGVVVPEKGFMERGLLEYVSNMADTKALCVFRELSETEAKEQLDEGKVAAYVTLPENLLEKIYRNEKTSVHITTTKTPTIESALMEELVDSAVSFVLTAKAGDYAAYQLYAKYGRQGSMKTVAMDMNRNYIRFVLRQETLFHEKTIKSASGMNDTTRIFLGIMVTLFILLGAILISLRERPTALLLGLLKGKKINPREIFMALPYKNKKFEYPRDVQSEVWKQWYEQRNNRDCILKMNTGSGKTVVALLILQSCLNENKGPAVYVVPDSYLVSQVIEQAAQLGIATTTDEKSIDFLRGRAILVINVHTLVNGKSKFGMREYNNVEFKSVIIDDVHACIATVQSQFKIYIDRKNDAYMDFVKLFIKELKSQSESKIMDILSEQNPYGNMLVPFWVWQDNISDIIKIINEARASDTNIDFSADLIIDSLKQCRGYISAEGNSSKLYSDS